QTGELLIEPATKLVCESRRSLKDRPVASDPVVLPRVAVKLIVSPGSALPSPLFAVTVSAAVMLAVTDPTVGGRGSGRGPGSGAAVGGLTKRLSVATFFVALSSDL